MDLTYIVDGTEVNFSGVSPARLATLPEDSPLCFDDPDDLVKELELNVPLSRFEDVVENYFDHGKFLVPMRRKKDGWLTIIDDSRLESFVELWMRLKLPQDTNFLLSREIVRSQRRDVIVQELAEVRTTLDPNRCVTTSLISNPALRSACMVQSLVRGSAHSRQCPPGFRTR
jgi:hypothetical protein